MPLVLLEMLEGRSPRDKRALLDAVHDALVETFKIPDADKHQRLIEYAREHFDIPAGKGDGFTIVQLDVFPGRSLDAKRALYKSIVARFEAIGVPPTDVFIVLREPPLENWGIRGGQAACDIQIGFNLKV